MNEPNKDSYTTVEQIESKIEDHTRSISVLWETITTYMASSPPAYVKADGDRRQPYPEFIVNKARQIRSAIESHYNSIVELKDLRSRMTEKEDL